MNSRVSSSPEPSPFLESPKVLTAPSAEISLFQYTLSTIYKSASVIITEPSKSTPPAFQERPTLNKLNPASGILTPTLASTVVKS